MPRPAQRAKGQLFPGGGGSPYLRLRGKPRGPPRPHRVLGEAAQETRPTAQGRQVASPQDSQSLGSLPGLLLLDDATAGTVLGFSATPGGPEAGGRLTATSAEAQHVLHGGRGRGSPKPRPSSSTENRGGSTPPAAPSRDAGRTHGTPTPNVNPQVAPISKRNSKVPVPHRPLAAHRPPRSPSAPWGTLSPPLVASIPQQPPWPLPRVAHVPRTSCLGAFALNTPSSKTFLPRLFRWA